jgi:hypothetical protein
MTVSEGLSFSERLALSWSAKSTLAAPLCFGAMAQRPSLAAAANRWRVEARLLLVNSF